MTTPELLEVAETYLALTMTMAEVELALALYFKGGKG